MNLTIEKLIYGGDGLARLPAECGADTPVRGSQSNGKAVFIPFTLGGETVAATLIDQKPGFARAQLEQILTPSPNRISPRCPYFQRCGGCHYQHTAYDHQLAIKSEILRETLRRQAKLELTNNNDIIVHPSEPWHYRNRARFQVRTSPEFVAGYFQFGSHTVLAVEQCPINSLLLNRALKALWELGRAAEIPTALRELEFFANADDTRLLAELWFTAETPATKRIALGEKLTNRLRDLLPDLTSAYVFPQSPTSPRGHQSLAEPQPDWALGGGQFRYRVGSKEFRVSGGSFFQVNRFLIDELVQIVTANRTGELALDLYAGVGLFTTALAPSFRHILAVESSQSSATDLKYNCPANGKVVRTTVEEYLIGAVHPGKGKPGKLQSGKTKSATPGLPVPDLVIVDPPRAGVGDRVAKALAGSAAPRITYVSCDPATLARDLVHLIAGGYRVEQVHLVDLFPQTFHLESVVHLVR